MHKMFLLPIYKSTSSTLFSQLKFDDEFNSVCVHSNSIAAIWKLYMLSVIMENIRDAFQSDCNMKREGWGGKSFDFC